MSAKPKKTAREQALNDLSGRLDRSADALDQIAERMQQAAEMQRKYQLRLQTIHANLRTAIQPVKPRKVTYLDYLEFSSAAELKRFQYETPISREDIESTDWDDLAFRLQAG